MSPLPVRALALIVLTCALSSARAQSIGFEVPRAYAPGTRSFNEEPFSHRYNNSTSPALYLNGNARQMWYQDYLDRLDRAERFGYCPPSGPKYQSPCDYPRSRIGIGIGFFGR